jgi:hypothetical protein
MVHRTQVNIRTRQDEAHRFYQKARKRPQSIRQNTPSHKKSAHTGRDGHHPRSITQATRDHIGSIIAVGRDWVLQFRRLSKPTGGMSFHNMRHLYLSIAIPKMLYAADVWFTPIRKSQSGKKATGSVGFATKMAKVQRVAALSITGALRSTPSDLLDAHADLMPIRLAVEKVTHNATLRMLTLPDNHPLHTHLQKASNYVKAHRSPLHELLRAHNLQAGNIEHIEPIRHKPSWTPPLHATTITEEKEAMAYDRHNTAMVRIYADGSGHEGGVGAAAILYINGTKRDSLQYYLGTDKQHTVYEAEVVGLILAATMLQEHNYLEDGTPDPSSQTVKHFPHKMPDTPEES